MWTRVLFVVAVAGGVLAVLAWALGFWDLSGGERGDDTTVSLACLEHFEGAAEAREEFPTRTASQGSVMFVDMSDAFRDCGNLGDWNIAASLYPESMSGTHIEDFVRQSCVRSVDLAGSATCRSLD